ncbi:DUF167 domain-containing protein [Peredibacter starrii]|uniref:UPF0235 protein SOO65_11175 n=1 Tax=Peredibacter starrii TaxID=28202 RepID=A0AAX4HJ40_9BACT|nr:DUF167 domain-containing protein [Peredibacter starrii]WPU63246.1 DUF167 domain-containing protein [Peredibacter starrii]
MSHWLKVHPKGCTLSLYVQPGASRSEVSGLHGDRLKVKIKAPPVDGEANEALIEFIAETLEIPKRSVHLTQGETSRQKTILVEMAVENVRAIIKD